MALFDSLKKAAGAVAGASQNKNRQVEVVFPRLPETLAEFSALPQAEMKTPFDTAALAVLAFCFYPENRELALSMLDVLRGPRPLSPMEKQFFADRFRDQDYVPRSYFKGATPENRYLPSEPYTVVVSEGPYSYQNQGYAKLYLSSGGADSPRSVDLRQAKDGKWYLWEQYFLVGIRKPADEDPWA